MSPQGGPMLVRGSGGSGGPSPDDDGGLLDGLPSAPSVSDVTDEISDRAPSRPSTPDIDVRDVAGKLGGPKGMIADRGFDFTTDRADDVSDGFDGFTDFLSDRRDQTADTARETGSDAREFVIDVGETATKPHRFVIDETRSAASSAGSAASDGFDEFGSALNTVFQRQQSMAEQIGAVPGMIEGAMGQMMEMMEGDDEPDGGLPIGLIAVGLAVVGGIAYLLFGGDD